MTETRAQLYTSSWQAPYHSFRRKRQNPFILLPLLSPKSFATLRGPHEVIAFCRKPIAWSLMISAKVPSPFIQRKLHFPCAGFASYPMHKLVALHDLDCPWRPGDLEQRSGRITRQGNRNKEVHIYRYVTESTFDAYLWQTVENKQKFISQIMTSKSPVRSCEDVDETALSYAEIKALCAGDKRIKEKMDLDVDVARLKLMKASHRSQQFRLEDNLLRHFPEQIRQNESFVEGFTADIQTLSAHPHPVDGFAGMEVKGDLLTDKDNAGAAILEAFKDAKGMEPVPIGSYRGFAMSLTVEDFGRDFILTLKGKMNHRVTLGKDARGNLTRIDNALNAMPDRLQNVRNTLDALTAQMETAKAELGKPFPQEDELRTKSARLAELNAELNIDDRTPMEQMAEDAPAVQSAKAERPSVLAKLKAPLSQPCAEDKIRHRGKEER